MRRVHALLIGAVLASTAFGGCQPAGAVGGGAGADGKLRVVTSNFPPYDFAREIAGDKVELTMLLSPGSESHSFEPTPQDIITIQNCDVFLYTGGENDAWMDKILESLDKQDMRILSMLDMVDAVPEELVEGMEHDHDDHEEHDAEEVDHDDHDHGEAELDEHVWTSPRNAMTIVLAITESLAAADPTNAGDYRQNAEAYTRKLEVLDDSFQEVMAGAARKTIVFGDRFPFRYLADAYGLQYYAAFSGCSTETEASAATVAFLIGKVKEEEIPAIFHIELSNEKMADAICEETGAEKLLLHSCHNVTRADFEAGVGYLSLMEQNVENLKKALA